MRVDQPSLSKHVLCGQILQRGYLPVIGASVIPNDVYSKVMHGCMVRFTYSGQAPSVGGARLARTRGKQASSSPVGSFRTGLAPVLSVPLPTQERKPPHVDVHKKGRRENMAGGLHSDDKRIQTFKSCNRGRLAHFQTWYATAKEVVGLPTTQWGIFLTQPNPPGRSAPFERTYLHAFDTHTV